VQFWWPLAHPGGNFYDELWMPNFSAPKERALLPWAQRHFLKNPPIQQGTLLDVGCGTGDFLGSLVGTSFDAWGIDISPDAVHSAKTMYNLTQVYEAKLEDFAARKDIPKFDVVTAFEVLEHVTDPNSFLDGVKKVLKPSGVLVLAIPNFNRTGKKEEHWDYPPHHFFRWPLGALQKFIEKHGFSISEMTEQPYGTHILYEKGWFSFGLIRFLKKHRKAGATVGSATTSRNLAKAADYKNFILRTILAPFFFPVTLLGRILGWKYVELYVVAHPQTNRQ
jgi:SAM-dependent methyltransferase